MTTQPSPHLGNTSGSSFSQRLGYFLTGTAIGLIALGFLMSSRQRAAQQLAAEKEVEDRRAQAEAWDAEEPAGTPPESPTERP